MRDLARGGELGHFLDTFALDTETKRTTPRGLPFSYRVGLRYASKDGPWVNHLRGINPICFGETQSSIFGITII